MEVIEYLYKELENISKAFPQIHFKYSYNSKIRTHVIELLPLEEYNNNLALDDAWIPLSFKFRELYPKDEIAFISSDSTLSNGETIFEFNPTIVCAEENLITKLFSSLSEYTLHYDFPTHMPTGLIIESSIGNFLNYPIEKSIDLSDSENLYSQAA